jgi:hypothetical protein
MTSFTTDGLLPAGERDHQWLRPGPSGEPVKGSLTWMSRIVQSNQIVLPAEIDGELVAPPPEHILDHLVRQRFSGMGPAEMLAEFELRPAPETVGVIDSLPACHRCRRGDLPHTARYEAPMPAEDRWALLCPACYRKHSTGRLGLGLGQYLLLESEVPRAVWVGFERACAHWNRRLDA